MYKIIEVHGYRHIKNNMTAVTYGVKHRQCHIRDVRLKNVKSIATQIKICCEKKTLKEIFS